MDAVVIIPSRLAATRLPNKPLLEINNKTMILRVVQQASKANCTDVIVAAGDQEIYDEVTNHGFKAILTPADLPTGSDRVYHAYQQLEQKYPYIINLQGDLPFVEPDNIKTVLGAIKKYDTDIATLASVITDKSEIDNPNVVKAVIAGNSKALYFSRATAPYGEGALYHHIGIYAYKAAALEKFVKLPVSNLETRERLEQLRALENDMTIAIDLVNNTPIAIDTLEDLQKARNFSNFNT